jgi:hypothetical protein
MEAGHKNIAQFIMPPSLSRQIDEVDLTLANGTADLVLDFAQCNFITVDGLEWLEELLLRSESLSSRVSFANVSPSVYKVFKVARIDVILKACGSISYACPSL